MSDLKARVAQSGMPRAPKPQLSITLFNVGHGDHILVEFPDGQLGIVDCCYNDCQDAPRALEYLESALKGRHAKGPCAIRFVCISHPHEDHIRGLGKVLLDERLAVKELWHSMSIGTELILEHFGQRSMRAFRRALPIAHFVRAKGMTDLSVLLSVLSGEAAHSMEVVQLIENRRMGTYGGVEVECLAPSETTLRKFCRVIKKDRRENTEVAIRERANDISSVLLLRFGNNRVLLTADSGSEVWGRVVRNRSLGGDSNDLPCRVCQAPHHGASAGVLGPAFGRVVSRPCVLVVSGSGRKKPDGTFYAAVGGHHVFCTNVGKCSYRDGDVLGDPCCGDIRIVVGRRAGDVRVETEELKPGACPG